MEGFTHITKGWRQLADEREEKMKKETIVVNGQSLEVTNTGITHEQPPKGRFDYVAYDEKAEIQQAGFKKLVTEIEDYIEGSLVSPRAKALALTHLETTYMWIGKAIRDDQIKRNGFAPLQEGRTNS
jgi:hypothetical protein